MARDGAGNYLLPAGNPVVTGTIISSTDFNATASDLGAGITQSLSRDGQTTATGNLPMGGFRHTGVADATARNHYASLGQVQDAGVFFLNTVAGTNTITAQTSPAIPAYVAGQIFWFISAGANTGAVTLNINSMGAKAITKNGTTALVSGDIASGVVVLVIYDGTRFQLATASSVGSVLNFLQTAAGAVSRTFQDKNTDILSAFDFMTPAQIADVKARTALVDVTAALNAATAAAKLYQKTLFLPAGVYLVTSVVTLECSMVGEGPSKNGTGTVIKWNGAGAKVFNTPTYISGWLFSQFRIDTTAVITDVTMMYFEQGLNSARFVDVDLKGAHSGSSFGGIYRNHDGIHIVGGSGATKYDVSQNRFERVFFLRNRRGLTVTDPSGQGPGNGNTFDGCFGWCSEWVVKMTGANNVIINAEFNYESGGRAIIQSGPFAIAWSYIVLNTQAAIASDQPVHFDTGGSANCASFDGGTLEEANGGGFPSLVLDAGPTGGKIFRYSVHGMNNVDSTVLRVDQILLGQAALSNNSYLYDKSSAISWVPAFTGLTVVLGAGSVTYSGKWVRIGMAVFWSAKIEPTGGATTASTAGTTRINNTPFSQVGLEVTCTAVNAATLQSYGVGSGAIGGTSMYTPTWAATASGITISGFFFTDGT